MPISPSVPTTWEQFRARRMKLDMSRGKPSPEQLDLSHALIDGAADAGHVARDGFDCRNYGLPAGLPEARELGAELLELPAAQVVAAGNSSLELMHDALAFALLYGVPSEAGDAMPWRGARDVAFLCPSPGYDRHFAICEALGVRMIAAPMNDDGPDMDFVEAQVRDDPSIKGIWCVPLYSNPTGAIWSEDVTRRLASMPAAPDFRLFWDDAYRFHHLTGERPRTPDVLAACDAAGHPDRAFVFASLSKVTLAGSALAWFASSPRNVAWWLKRTAVRTIGPDKLNQLRHVRFVRDRATLDALMDRHRAILKPKFDAVDDVFRARLAGIAGVRWTRPRGGYFISLYAPEGNARRTVELAADAGLVLTPAGAAFPYGVDPSDSHLRIAPSFPSLDEVALAAEGIALSLLKAIDERRR
ncbi:aminotransferase class I/II-fold pyridoxal phosphate-dependent enzyme [Paraburkholderia caballeronis]|uniref:DNA-binding transcriptional regulator, MocR family, contains an aminotransferase domain n=1 Tax=Paraburkholderia caballeronis TaxID=416943 RepID=A0A1H7U2J7_9BURK|nr:aminotransferase class I/II-fold pyridoxal phosphate-dependent enzyme [Paraburkholderia caballeronis]PXW23481.1 DNA-binding transcriptional MocR family regulator [Paraburkholderia caballeronis]PXW98474.1 DNA-binding transcriptional MocR family regulator [Paraburkholderia caballeronis]RAJ95205.1 DNA-binding transcriptional MocR family regulator [Paraburkholderia caballeronis]SEC50917.1 DNA-binding transcriptional regulator, MocR family, contains an aminotransferase domain [Paraburkholderia ca